MQKIIIFLCALVCTGITTFKIATVTNKEGEEQGPQWFSQWYDMKKNAQGEIPQLLHHQWATQDAKLYKTNGGAVLDSITAYGPDNVGGRTRAIIVDWSDTTHYFAGSVAGGLWESKNEGATWKPVNDNQENLNISAITQSPFNKNIYYYCTGEPYPIADLSSNTGGQLGGGVFKSTDGGVTFSVLASTLNANFTSTWDIKHDKVDPNTIYVATENKGLFKSTDGGTTFTNVYSTTASITRIETLNDGSILFACTGNGIFKSTSGNLGTFTKLSNGFASGSYGLIEFAVCANFPNVMFALVSSSSNSSLLATYKSSNGGASWRTCPTASVGYSYTWFCLAASICATDTNKIMLGSVSYGYTVNGGANWNTSNLNNSHADYHIFYNVPGSSKVLCGNDGGVYKYDWNSMGNFTSLNNGYHVTQFYAGSFFKSGVSMIMGAQDNGSHRITNGNKTASNIYGGDGCFTGINQQDDAKGYFSYQGANIYKATNLKSTPTTGGFMSFSNTDAKWFINPFEINPADGNQIYVPTKSRLYRSTGSTFSSIINATTKQPYAIGISNETNPVLYYGGSSMLLARIDSAATTVAGKEKSLTSTMPSGLTTDFVGCIKVHPANRNTIFITLTNYNAQPRVWKITRCDSVPVWTSISGNLPSSLPCNSFEVDPWSPDSRFIVATDFGLYVTDDGGATWTKDTRIPNVCIYNIRLRTGDRKLFIFTHGRSAWTANILPYSTVRPTADFTFSGTTVCEGIPTTFTDNSVNSPTQYLWKFENGTPSTATNYSSSCVFTGSGVKKVKLIVSNSFGTDSIEKLITVLANPKPGLVQSGMVLSCTVSASTYTWYRGTTLLSGNTPSFTATFPGWYRVKVTNSNGCSATSDSIQVFSAGIQNSLNKDGFYLYPNPAAHEIYLVNAHEASFKIVTLDGKVMMEKTCSEKTPTILNIDKLHAGVYLMVLTNKEGTKTIKFIKQ